jgi:DNA-binding transcriptional LysR family regulator
MLKTSTHRINAANLIKPFAATMKPTVPPVSLTHRMLEVFAAVILHGGIGAAARALAISQPSVSRLIADMEKATGLALFVKRGRSVAATTQAIALYGQIERSFIGVRDIAQFAEQMRQEQQGRLVVGCLPALGYSVMPAAIADLRASMPKTTVYLQIEPSLSVAQMVATMQVDIGFVASGLQHSSAVQKIGSLSGLCRCILPSGHGLAAGDTIRPAQLTGQPFVALPLHSRIRQGLEAIMSGASQQLSVVAETRQTPSASDLVLRGVGIAVVDPFVALEHERRGGRSARFEPAMEYGVDIVAHSDSRLGLAARTMMAFIAQRTRHLAGDSAASPN